MKCFLFYFVLNVLFVATSVTAQTNPAAIKITGDNIQPTTLTAASLSDMKILTLDAKGHDEKMHRYEGVLVSDVLSKAGVQLGEGAKKTTSNTYVLVKAADNYSVIYALAEIDPLFTDKTIIIANKEDGKALPQGIGPFQMIVPGEKKHARWIRQVVSITIVTVK